MTVALIVCGVVRGGVPVLSDDQGSVQAAVTTNDGDGGLLAADSRSGLAMDTATSGIRAVEFTSSRDGDSPVPPALLDHVRDVDKIGTVAADGADNSELRPFGAETGRWPVSDAPHRAAAIPPSSTVRPSRSFRSARTADPGQSTARQHEHGTKPYAQRATMAGRSGNAGPDTTPQQDRGQEALPQSLREAHRRERP